MGAVDTIEPDRLQAALRWARERYAACDVCAERCGVDRLGGALGRCGLPAHGRVYKEYLHLGEERCLIPSHAIYLTGCNMRCVFCSDLGPVQHPEGYGVALAPEALAQRIATRRTEGARNVNFVGGLPDVNLLYILETLAHCPTDTHVVWNTNLWTTPEAIAHLQGIVRTWLVDLKFGQDRCGLKLGAVAGYRARVDPLLSGLQGHDDVIVRHLVMPGHLTCCTVPVLGWLKAHLPRARVNLMLGYHPFQLAGHGGPLGRQLTATERAEALAALAAAALPQPLVDGEAWTP